MPLHGNHGIDEVLIRSLRADAGAGANNIWYFRFRSRLWKCSKVEGFKTIAEPRSRAARIKSVHSPAMIRSAVDRLGARLRPRLRISN